MLDVAPITYAPLLEITLLDRAMTMHPTPFFPLSKRTPITPVHPKSDGANHPSLMVPLGSSGSRVTGAANLVVPSCAPFFEEMYNELGGGAPRIYKPYVEQITGKWKCPYGKALGVNLSPDVLSSAQYSTAITDFCGELFFNKRFSAAFRKALIPLEASSDRDVFAANLAPWGFNGIDLTSKMGRPRGGYVSDYYNRDGATGHTEPSANFRSLIMRDEADDFDDPQYTVGFLKSGEMSVGPEAKLARVVNVVSFDVTVLARRVMLPIRYAMINSNVGCNVGINMYDPDVAHEFFDLLHDHTRTPLGIDYSSWDNSIPMFEILMMLHEIERYAVAQELADRYAHDVRNLRKALSQAVYIANGDTYQRVLGLPSGIPGTSEFNTLLALFVLWHVIKHKFPDIDMLENFADFKPKMYGDDLVFFPLATLKMSANDFSYASVFNRTATLGSKASLESASVDRGDIAFLNRTPRYDPHLGYVNALAKTSIIKPLIMREKSDFQLLQTGGIVRCTLVEAAFHGIDFYNDVFSGFAQDSQSIPHLISHETIVSWYRSGGSLTPSGLPDVG